jgi:outer membrane protein assembly factor BamB
VDEARVYFMSRDNLLRANDRRQGAQRWSQSAPGRVLGGPMRSEEFVILASLTPQLHAYRRTTGEVAGTSPSPVGNALQSALDTPGDRRTARVRRDGRRD